MNNTNGAATKLAKEKIEDKTEQQNANTADKYSEIVNQYARNTIEKANQITQQIGGQATDFLSASSEYIKNIDFNAAGEKVKKTIKDKPEISLAVAATAGLLVGFWLARKSK